MRRTMTSSAPSATLLTLREVEAEGRTSRALLLLVGLNNLITLLVFPWLNWSEDPVRTGD